MLDCHAQIECFRERERERERERKIGGVSSAFGLVEKRAELPSGLAFEEKWKTQLYCQLRETYSLPATTMVSSF